MGGGLMTWAQLSAIHEPYNHTRRIVGFDTFAGFPSLAQQDATAADASLSFAKVGGLAVQGIEDDIRHAVSLYDLNRPLGHIERVELVKGDAQETIPAYLEENKHTVVALLYLDFDLFEPTLAALTTFLPRMPKGAVLVFDELNHKYWPGETLCSTSSTRNTGPARPLPCWSRPESGISGSGDFRLHRKSLTQCSTDAAGSKVGAKGAFKLVASAMTTGHIAVLSDRPPSPTLLNPSCSRRTGCPPRRASAGQATGRPRAGRWRSCGLARCRRAGAADRAARGAQRPTRGKNR